MLEIPSNFRISLDLFGLANFGTTYSLQTADKAIAGCTKVALRYFGSFMALWYFLVRTLLSKMIQLQKCNALRSGDIGFQCAVEMKRESLLNS